MDKPSILLLGTCDTKLEELIYVREQMLQQSDCLVQVLDIGFKETVHPTISFSRVEVLNSYYHGLEKFADHSSLDRGGYVKHMIPATTAFVRNLTKQARSLDGIISIGGSTGTSLAAEVMRNSVPIGFPKLLLSTMASGDVSAYVDNVDITMMYSVVDIAGLNFLSQTILSNAAGAITGMANAFHRRMTASSGQGIMDRRSDIQRKKRIGLTMFGVTTPACDHIRAILTEKHGHEVIVFHATGAGGRAMERLVKESVLDAVVDLTTTEVADEVVGGVLSAGPGRLSAAAEAGIPQIVSVGACDMVNFGPRESVPKKWDEEGRKVYVHNPAVTLMRTSVQECRDIGRFIAENLRDKAARKELVKVILPVGGVSMIAASGGIFEDRDADEALFQAIEQGLEGSGISVERDSRAINDEAFAELVVERMLALM